MEIFVAISDFTPPNVDGSQNILEFKKGDSFEIFDSSKTEADWWGARALKSDLIGYVPSRYMQYEEKRIGKLLPEDYKDQKETSLKRLSDIQSSPNYKAPDEVIPDTPLPDYEDFASPQNQSVFNFAEKFKTVLSNINQIERSYSYDMEKEPEPDYNDEQDGNISERLEVQLRDGQPQKERTPSQSSDDGLIAPKKLKNPCLESTERQALHKELLLNYKRGVNVLEKPELNKVLQQRRETQRKKEKEEEMKSKRTSFEMKLEQRATKLKSEDEMRAISEEEKPEYQKVFAKITQKSNGHVK